MSQTAVFTQLVRDHIGDGLVTVPPACRCDEASERMREEGASSIIIEGEDGAPTGILTEQDFARRLAWRVDPATPVGEVMHAPVLVINDDDLLYHAIGRMRRRNLRHMPVTDARCKPIGILHLHQALAAASASVIQDIDRLTQPASLEGLKETRAAQVAVAQRLFRDHTPAPEIQALLTQINNDLYRRIVKLSLAEMERDQWGEPPVEFEMLVMGSGGRGESFLGPDQDNGFILADYPDAEHDRIDRWFIELAERMTRQLDEIGIVYCPGSVMATNPLWRKTLSQWQRQARLWVGKGAGTVLRLCDIFFDFTTVYGSGAMSRELRKTVTKVGTNRFFLRQMYAVDEDHRVALGLFGHLIRDREKGPNQGKINLKITGTLPLVGAVRIMALKEGITETSTLKRITALRARDLLSEDEADYLIGAYHHITRLLLRQQLKDVQEGRPPGKHVAPATLTTRETDILVDSFRAIRRFRKRVRGELTADIF